MVLRFLICTVVLGWLLPALGLIQFHGDWLDAAFATLCVGISLWLSAILLGWLMAWFTGLAIIATLGIGALIAPFVFLTLWSACALWFASGMTDSLVLINFWHTIGAGALLALIFTEI